MTSLQNLPVEVLPTIIVYSRLDSDKDSSYLPQLIHEIHCLALNPNLTIVSPWLRDALRGVSTAQRANWLISYAELKKRTSPNVDDDFNFARVVDSSLRHTICTAPVLVYIGHIYLRAHPPSYGDIYASGYRAASRHELPQIALPRWLFSNICICTESNEYRSGPSTADHKSRCTATGSRPPHIIGAVHLVDQRAQMRTVSEVLDIISALDSIRFYRGTPNLTSAPPREIFVININAHKGTALTLSSAFGAQRLISALLERGADPSYNRSLAVRAAVRRKDLQLVRMLVERPPENANASPRKSMEGSHLGTLREETSPPRSPPASQNSSFTPAVQGPISEDTHSEGRPNKSAKRRRLLDRVEITSELVGEAMRLDARDIVDYFVIEKGCSPDIRTLGQSLFK